VPFLLFTDTGTITDFGEVTIAERRPLRTFFGNNSVEAVEATPPNPVPSLPVEVEEVCAPVCRSSNGESARSSSSSLSFFFKLWVGEQEKKP
jgi:hypothetical protein